MDIILSFFLLFLKDALFDLWIELTHSFSSVCLWSSCWRLCVVLVRVCPRVICVAVRHNQPHGNELWLIAGSFCVVVLFWQFERFTPEKLQNLSAKFWKWPVMTSSFSDWWKCFDCFHCTKPDFHINALGSIILWNMQLVKTQIFNMPGLMAVEFLILIWFPCHFDHLIYREKYFIAYVLDHRVYTQIYTTLVVILSKYM